jgi:hypothetical protein
MDVPMQDEVAFAKKKGLNITPIPIVQPVKRVVHDCDSDIAIVRTFESVYRLPFANKNLIANPCFRSNRKPS